MARMTERLEQLRRAVGRPFARVTSDVRTGPPPCVGCRGVPIDRLDPVEPADGPIATPDTVVQPADGLQMAEIDGQLVVLDPISARRILLNASAALIFTAIDQTRTVGELVDQIASETGADSAELEADVLATVDRLLASGMVAIADDQGRARHEVTLAVEAGRTGLTGGEPAGTDAADEAPRSVGAQSELEPADSDWSYVSGTRMVAGISVEVRAAHDETGTSLDRLLA